MSLDFSKIERKIEEDRFNILEFYDNYYSNKNIFLTVEEELFLLSKYYFEIRDNDKYLQILERSLKISKIKLNDKICYYCHNSFAQFYTEQKKYDKALFHFMEILDNSDKMPCKKDCALNNIGDLYLRIGNYEKAVNFFNEALEIAKNNRVKAVIYQNLGETYIRIKKYKEGKENLIKAMDITNKYLSENLREYRINSCKLLLMEINLNNWDLDNIEKEYLELYEIFGKHNDKKKFNLLKLLFSQYLMKRERFSEAQSLLEEILPFYIEINDKNKMKSIYKTLLQTSRILGQREKYISLLEVCFEKCLEIDENMFFREQMELKFKNIKLIKLADDRKKKQCIYEIALFLGECISNGENKRKLFLDTYNLLNKWFNVPIMWIGFIEDKEYLNYDIIIEMGEYKDSIKMKINDEKCLGGLAINKSETIILENLRLKSNEDLIIKPRIHYHDMKSGIYIPLVINNKCIGVISFQTFKDDISFEEEKNFFEKIAPYIALVVEKLYYI